MGYKSLGKLIVSKDNKTWTASLDEQLKWHSKSSYLRRYLNQILTNCPRHSARTIMKSTKMDLEYGSYLVKLDQSHESVISDIIGKNKEIRDFWSSAHGWAPNEVAELLAKSRLDWQVSLSYCLRLWLDAPSDDDVEGRLILAWANLGSLVEGTMKFFLSVHEADYSNAPHTRGKDKTPCDIDALQFEELKQFFNQKIWIKSQEKWNSWLTKIQQRRNAIHAYKDRDIGTFNNFFKELCEYLDFLEELEGRVPYP